MQMIITGQKTFSFVCMYLQYQLWKITTRLAYRPTANTERIQIPFANINFFENVALFCLRGV